MPPPEHECEQRGQSHQLSETLMQLGLALESSHRIPRIWGQPHRRGHPRLAGPEAKPGTALSACFRLVFQNTDPFLLPFASIHSLVLFATRTSDPCASAGGKIKSCRCYALGPLGELDSHTFRSMIKQSRETQSTHVCFPFPAGHLQGGDSDNEKIVINYNLFWARKGWTGER